MKCFRDVGAMFLAALMTLGIVYLRALGESPPPELATAFGVAVTWVFVQSTNHPAEQSSPEEEEWKSKV